MKQEGFNLIELLIAVAVIGILTSVAFPAYKGYINGSRRADAKVALVAFAQAMERSYSEKNQYTGLADGGADTGVPAVAVFVPPSGLADSYTFTITNSTATTFTLSAIPKGPQATDACGTLTITDTGSTTASAAKCW